MTTNRNHVILAGRRIFGYFGMKDKLGFGAQCALPIAAALLVPDGKVILPVAK
jgi:hypothetical protein